MVEIGTGSRIPTWRTFVFFQTGNSYISAVDWATVYNLYNVNCTKVPPMYQNSLWMMSSVLNIDPVLRVPNATGVPNVTTVPIVPKNDQERS